jgi:hypothetical protein
MVDQTLSPGLDAACEELGIVPHEYIDLRGTPVNGVEPPSVKDQPPGWHRHVVIEWEGGLIWLDTSEQSNHFCIDVRQYALGERIRMGVFAIEDGRRLELQGTEYSRLRDTVLGHRAVDMPILLTDKP